MVSKSILSNTMGSVPFFFFCFPFLFVADIFFLTPPYLTIGFSQPPTDGVPPFLSFLMAPSVLLPDPSIYYYKTTGSAVESQLVTVLLTKDRFSLVADFCIF
jgi:hypothetical protein